jgi:hypothetical protein
MASKVNTDNLDPFTRAYIECALWSSCDDEEPLDKNHDIDDIAAETLDAMIVDCRRFQAINAEWIKEEFCQNSEWNVESMAGHDFFLTRQGHGSGYWDGDWAEPAGQKLTASSKAFGWFDLYVGDDGKIYH